MIKALYNLYGTTSRHPLQDYFGYNYSIQEYADMHTILHYANLQQNQIFTEQLKDIRNNLWFPIAYFRTGEINIKGTVRNESGEDYTRLQRLCAYILPKRYGSIDSARMRVYRTMQMSDTVKNSCAQSIALYESYVPQFDENHTFEKVSTDVSNNFMNCITACAKANRTTIIQQSLPRKFLNWCFSLVEKPILLIITPLLKRALNGI
jgi:hypothetical protein